MSERLETLEDDIDVLDGCPEVEDGLEGRRTELAGMAGAVRRLAEESGIPVPVHSTVLSLLGALGVG